MVVRQRVEELRRRLRPKVVAQEERPQATDQQAAPPRRDARAKPRQGGPQFRIFHVGNLVRDGALDGGVGALDLGFGRRGRNHALDEAQFVDQPVPEIGVHALHDLAAPVLNLERRRPGHFEAQHLAAAGPAASGTAGGEKRIRPGDARKVWADDGRPLRLQSHDRRVAAFRHAGREPLG